ncbi:MAG: hypothetical protein MCS20_01880 [Candidatus Phytoplasma mali]|nr:hypothetical protein [Candidatus Phytoplasma mali]
MLCGNIERRTQKLVSIEPIIIYIYIYIYILTKNNMTHEKTLVFFPLKLTKYTM